jgi:hypothetical protein
MALGCVNEWRASATQASVEMALSFMLSWYDKVQLGQLATPRSSSSLPSIELHARSITIDSYVDTEEYIANPDVPAAGAGDDEGHDATEDDVVDPTDGDGGDEVEVVADSSPSLQV